jgi:hypothetical protein
MGDSAAGWKVVKNADRTGAPAHGTPERWRGCGDGPSCLSAPWSVMIQLLANSNIHHVNNTMATTARHDGGRPRSTR